MKIVNVLSICVALTLFSCSVSATQRKVTPLIAHCVVSLHDQLQSENRLDELSPDFITVFEGIQANNLEQPEALLLGVAKELQFFGFLVQCVTEITGSSRQ